MLIYSPRRWHIKYLIPSSSNLNFSTNQFQISSNPESGKKESNVGILSLFHHGWKKFQILHLPNTQKCFWGEHCYIFKFQLCLPPKLNFKCYFRAKNFPPQAEKIKILSPGKSDPKFPFLLKRLGRNDNMPYSYFIISRSASSSMVDAVSVWNICLSIHREW